jgi:hypothetical protein
MMLRKQRQSNSVTRNGYEETGDRSLTWLRKQKQKRKKRKKKKKKKKKNDHSDSDSSDTDTSDSTSDGTSDGTSDDSDSNTSDDEFVEQISTIERAPKKVTIAVMAPPQPPVVAPVVPVMVMQRPSPETVIAKYNIKQSPVVLKHIRVFVADFLYRMLVIGAVNDTSIRTISVEIETEIKQLERELNSELSPAIRRASIRDERDSLNAQVVALRARIGKLVVAADNSNSQQALSQQQLQLTRDRASENALLAKLGELVGSLEQQQQQQQQQQQSSDASIMEILQQQQQQQQQQQVTMSSMDIQQLVSGKTNAMRSSILNHIDKLQKQQPTPATALLIDSDHYTTRFDTAAKTSILDVLAALGDV